MASSVKRVASVALLAGALALLAGCGGGDGDDTTGLPTSDVSQANYIAQADKVCAEENKTLQKASVAYFGKLGLGANESPTTQQFANFAKASLIPSVQAQLDQLREIEAPAEDADQIAKVYDTAQQELDAVKADPASVAGDPFAKANALAQDYGFKVCGAG